MAPSGQGWAAFPAAVTAIGFGLVVAGALAPGRPEPSPSTRAPASRGLGSGRTGVPAGPESRGLGLAPFAPAVLPSPARRVPPDVDLDAEDPPELVGVVWADAWDDRRALLRWRDDVRAYAVSDFVPGGDVVVGIARDAVTLSRGDTVVRLSKDGVAQVVEDFPLADRTWTGEAAAPPDPELEAAVYETLALLQLGEPATAQVAMNALVEAGELVVPYLVRRADDLQPLPPLQLSLPDGRVFSPRWEAVAAQAALEAITGQRFGDVLAPDVTVDRVLDAAAAWRSWLGLPD